MLSLFFTELSLSHAAVVVYTVVMTAALFSLGGFINAVYAKSFDDISIVPTFVLTPLTYLGGVFYSIDMLPAFWQKVTLLNPVVYLVNGFRWSFYGVSDVAVEISLAMTLLFLAACLLAVRWIFKTGYRLKT